MILPTVCIETAQFTWPAHLGLRPLLVSLHVGPLGWLAREVLEVFRWWSASRPTNAETRLYVTDRWKPAGRVLENVRNASYVDSLLLIRQVSLRRTGRLETLVVGHGDIPDMPDRGICLTINEYHRLARKRRHKAKSQTIVCQMNLITALSCHLIISLCKVIEFKISTSCR